MEIQITKLAMDRRWGAIRKSSIVPDGKSKDKCFKSHHTLNQKQDNLPGGQSGYPHDIQKDTFSTNVRLANRDMGHLIQEWMKAVTSGGWGRVSIPSVKLQCGRSKEGDPKLYMQYHKPARDG